MKKMRGLIGAAVTIALLSGCATQQNYQLAVNSWQGASGTTLFHVWGYPHKTKSMPQGHKLYIYSYRDKGQYPIYATPGSTVVETGRHGQTYVQTTAPTVSGGGTYDYRCKTWFEVNRKNIVVNTSFRGNNCVATSDFLQERANPSKKILTNN